jgi:hypothetical protein
LGSGLHNIADTLYDVTYVPIRMDGRLAGALTLGRRFDFAGLEWVAQDVVTRFLGENRARLGDLGRWIRLENLHGVARALRSHLGDIEVIRLIESAASRA